MKRHTPTFVRCFALMIALCCVAEASAQPVPVVVQPGFKVVPFSGFWAGGQAFANPNFGLVTSAIGGHPAGMYVAELAPAKACVSIVNPNGFNTVYTTPQFGTGAAGIDIDAAVDSLAGFTSGLFGGPMMMYVGLDPVAAAGGVVSVAPGGAWAPFGGPLCFPGYSALTFDRTPSFQYGGQIYLTDWGNDQTDAILRMLPNGAPVPFAQLAFMDPRHIAFDATGGATGFGPGLLWVSSWSTGMVFSMMPNGAIAPPLMVLPPGIEGLAFARGDGCFGSDLYVANALTGTIDIVRPNGTAVPFAAGFPSAAELLFVSQGPFAMNGKPTLYVLDGIDTVWVITPIPTPTPADLDGDATVGPLDLAILLGAWGPCTTFPCIADLDGDGMVGAADLALLLGAWGSCWRC